MKGYLKYIILGISIILSILALWYFKNIVVFILLAVVFSFIGRPLVTLLNKMQYKSFHMPRALSALITLLVLWAIIAGFLLFFIPLLVNQIQELSKIDLNAIQSSLSEPLGKIEAFINRYQLYGEGNVSFEQILEERLVSFLNFSSISSAIGGTVGILGQTLFTFFAVSFITFFFLKDKDLFGQGILLFVPTEYEERFRNFFDSAKKLLTRYFIGILLQVSSITVLVTLGMLIVGIKFQLAVVIGFIAGIFNVIPYLGPLIGATIGIVLGIANNLGLEFYSELLPLLGYMSIVFIIVQVIDNVLHQPLIYGRSVKAHPLEIFLVIIIAGSLAGIPGMILAIPGYTVIRVFAREFLSSFKLVKKLTEKIN